ncbi:hypothetical protein BJX99DRAFT_217242 [Aspergillus californicus]
METHSYRNRREQGCPCYAHDTMQYIEALASRNIFADGVKYLLQTHAFFNSSRATEVKQSQTRLHSLTIMTSGGLLNQMRCLFLVLFSYYLPLLADLSFGLVHRGTIRYHPPIL